MATQKQNDKSEKQSKEQEPNKTDKNNSEKATETPEKAKTTDETKDEKNGQPANQTDKPEHQTTGKDTGDNVEVINDPRQAFPDNSPVDPSRFKREQEGTYDQETEEEFERPGEQPSVTEEDTGDKEGGSKHNMEYYTTKAVLKFSEFGLGTLHERRRFTPEERKKIKKIRRQDSEELEEEDQKLWQQYQETKKEQKQELEFDDDEIDSIVEPLKELALHSNIKIDDPRVALIFCVAVIMWPRIQFVMQG